MTHVESNLFFIGGPSQYASPRFLAARHAPEDIARLVSSFALGQETVIAWDTLKQRALIDF